MVRSRSAFPREGEFIVGRVRDIQNQYVYVDLLDYEGLPSERNAQGMIHIREISSRWVKSIRNHLREGQRVVLRVLRVDEHKGHVDLSLRRVNSAQRKNRMKEWKYAVKFENLLQFLADEVEEMTLSDAYGQIGFPVLELFEDQYQETVEELKENGEQIVEEIKDVSDEIKEKFLQIVNENVKISTVSIIGKLELIVRTSNGIELIKNTLKEAKSVIEPKETRRIEITYLGAPSYRIEVVSKDYLDAENILSDFLEVIEKNIEDLDELGEYEFVRD
ncbi:MAG: translation initiation factor IF-2 subunit alpha [Promethearchaeia archaeon]